MWLHIVGQKLYLWCCYLYTKLHTVAPEVCNILIFQFFLFRSLSGWTHCHMGSKFSYLNIILNQAELQWLFILLFLFLFLGAVVMSIYFLMTLFELCSVSDTLSQVSHTGYWIRCWETHSLLLGTWVLDCTVKPDSLSAPGSFVCGFIT